MSQSKVKDFFTSRKGIRDLQPSKRRKLDPVPVPVLDGSGSGVISISTENENKKRPDMEEPQLSVNNTLTNQASDNNNCVTFDKSKEPTTSKSKSVTLPKLPRSGSQARPRSTRGKKTKSVPPSKGQQKLDFKAVKVDSDAVTSSNSVMESVSLVVDSCGSGTESGQVQESKHENLKLKCMEEVTSVWDDHKECTPRKRIISEMDSLSQGPKARIRKTAARKLNQDDQSDSPSSPQREVKKKLELDNKAETEISKPKPGEPCSKSTDGSSKTDLLNLVTEMSGVQGAISPLALTPENENVKSSGPTLTTITPKLHDLSTKLKMLSKMDGQALKNRLKKKGMLGEVKEKLQELSKASAESKMATPTPVEPVSKENSEEKLPAYQRYDYLVKEGPPTLALPYTYRLLENAFQAMDTVVSMLHNRSEVCTFDKLQASVQNITKKNFPQKTVGQIKTVVPEAYTYKQEKIPVYGQRTSPYVLTIEANLNDNSDVNKNITKDGKIPFSASLLLRRKASFKASLLKILKKHHRTFLESLNTPLRIPDDKLSRWHPKFALDKVPDVTISDLPQSPNLQIFRSAKDVLDMQVGKLNPRVEKALSKVVAESSDANKNSSLQNVIKSKASSTVFPVNETLNKPNASSPNVLSPKSSPTQSSMKGIPPVLLAKIRAKEALKMEQALTRDPAEDRKMRMLGHLPEIIRILRSYFVTEKRPALPLESVIKKLGDSYHTGMSQGEIEQHIKLLRETAPELMSIVEIKRGKFVKLDKNVDISALSDRIMNIVKSNK